MTDELTYAVIGAAMQVHREMGPGFLEITYQRALALELTARQISYRREVAIPVWYRGSRSAPSAQISSAVETCC